MTATGRDEIAEQLAAAAGPGMADLYEVDAATRRLFVERADRVRRFVAAELRRQAVHVQGRRHVGGTDGWFDAANMAMDMLNARADELDPS